MKYIIANWKANKTYDEASAWVKEFSEQYKPNPDVAIIICPPFPFLTLIAQSIEKLTQVSIGVQTISSVEKGPYTGETTVYTIQSLAGYAMIGHSERRKYFQETEEEIQKKLKLVNLLGLGSILCIRGTTDVLYPADFVAYEPDTAISTGPVGKNEPIENVIAVKEKLQLPPITKFIYGGSVDENNCRRYLDQKEIDGVLVGSASLETTRFLKLIAAV